MSLTYVCIPMSCIIYKYKYKSIHLFSTIVLNKINIFLYKAFILYILLNTEKLNYAMHYKMSNFTNIYII